MSRLEVRKGLGAEQPRFLRLEPLPSAYDEANILLGVGISEKLDPYYL